MSEKELPPLRVRIIGDDSDLKKTLKDVVDHVDKVGDNIAKTGKKVQKETAKASREAARTSQTTNNEAVQATDRQVRSIKKWVKDMKSKVKDIQSGGKREWNRMIEGVDQQLKQQAELRKQADKDADRRAKEADDRAKARRKEMDDAAEKRAKEADARQKERIKQRAIEAQRASLAASHGPSLKELKEAKAYAQEVQKGLKAMHGPNLQEILDAQRHAANFMGPAGNYAAMHGPSPKQLKQAQAQFKQQQGSGVMHGPSLAQLQQGQQYHQRQQAATQARTDRAERARIRRLNQEMDRMSRQVQRHQEQAARHQQRQATQFQNAQYRADIRNQQQLHRDRLGYARQLGNFQRSLQDRRTARADMGFGLGARADIYMHINALKNIVQTGKGFLDVAISFEQSQVAIAAFTGDLIQADRIMARIQDYAIASPYQTVQLADMARNMMSYGIAADDAVNTLQMLGDVAGGSGLRLERLSFAMSQISSMGRLQGQELRQLTEQGFNPLETISRKTGHSMMTLKKAMEDGKISAQMVTEALKVETSAGGRFAAMAQKMQNSLGGMINQVRELIQKMSLTMVKALEGDMKKALLYTIERLKTFITYLETPAGKEAIKRFAEIAKHVLVMAVTFHTVGLAIAVMRWQVASLATILSVLQMVLVPMRMALALLVGPLMLAAHAIQAFLTGTVVGFIGFATSLATSLIGLGAMGMAVAGVRDLVAGRQGLGQAFEDLPNRIKKASMAIQGFFYNIEENWKIVVQWFRQNYDALMSFAMATTNNMLKALGNNIMVIGEFLIEAFMIGIDWIEANLPMIIDRLMAASKSAVAGAGRGLLKSKGMQGAFNEILYTAMGPIGSYLKANLGKGTKLGQASVAGNALTPVGLMGAAAGTTPEGGAASTKLLDAANKMVTNLMHGFEVGEKAPTKIVEELLAKLKTDLPKIEFPELPELKMPEEFTPDFSALGNLAQSLQGIKLTDTAAYRSAEHAKQVYEYTRNMEAIQAGLKGDTKKDDVQKQQLKALQGIEKNTRPGAAPQAANLAAP